MQAANPQPRITVARSVIELLQQAAMNPSVRPVPEQSIGGILIGKRLSGNQIAIVGASTPGPAPDNHQLGFALDQSHANATLEEWFTRDAAVDFIGLWHTHPAELAHPSAGDVQVTRKLLADPAYNTTELVNLIVQLDQRAPRIRCFYLHQNTVGAAAVNFVTYEILEDTHPRLLAPSVAESPIPPVGAITAPTTVSATVPRRALRVVALVCLLVLLLGGLFLANRQLRRTNGSAPDSQTAASGTSESAATTILATPAAGVAPATASASTLPSATTTSSLVTAEPAVIGATSPSPLPSASPSPAPTLQSSGHLPYALQLEPMDAAYRQGFLNRLRLAKCIGCYNIDLVSPVPFRQMRINIAGSAGPPLNNYVAPSPVEFLPRPQPYTLQAFDLQGNPLSEPLTFTVTSGSLYVLRITPAAQGAVG